MKRNVFAISGFSCAGKSTLIRHLIDIWGLTTIRYGDIHREAIKRHGYKLGMDWIKSEGFDAYEDGALEVFIEELDKCDSENLIIDGIFSNKCYQYLKQQESLQVKNILLETSYENRLRRMIEREGLGLEKAEEKLKSVDWLKYYAGLSKIMQDADYVIDSGYDREFITCEVDRIVKSVIKEEQELTL